MLGGSPWQPCGGGLRGAKAAVGEISQDFWGLSLWLYKSDRAGWGGPGTHQLREKIKALEACLKWLPDSESNSTLVCWLLSLPHPPPLWPKRPVTPYSQIPALPRGLRTGQLSAFNQKGSCWSEPLWIFTSGMPGHKSPNIVFPLTPSRLSPAHRAAIEGLRRPGGGPGPC